MLQAIRERASGWFAWVLFAFISIPFALWGVNQYFDADPNPPVAKVNGAEIGLNAFQQAYSEQRQRLRAALGDRFDDANIDASVLARGTLDQMVADEALLQGALNNGLRISNEQVAATIRAESTFDRDGAFSQPAYQAWLRNQGFTSAGFEFRLRRNLIADQLSRGIAETTVVAPSSSARLAALVQQRRSFSMLSVPLQRYVPATVDDAAVAAYFDGRRDDFVTPERVVAQYVVLSRAVLASTVEVNDEALEARYESEKANYSAPEQRKVSHILLQLPPNAGDDDIDAAMARIQELRKRIVDGEDFAAVAAQASEDPGSAAQGGDLGYFARGIMDKSFEDAAFAQQQGVVGEPVRSDFGLHLILVTDVKAGGVKPFSEVRSQLLTVYQQEQTEQRFFEQVERLANLTFEHPDSLEPAADTLGLAVRVSDRFGRSGSDSDELVSRPEVLRAAFSEDVLQGNNSQPIDLGDGRVMVLRVDERIPSAPQSLDEARPEIERRLGQEAAETRLRALAAELLPRLRSGESRENIAAELELQWLERKDAGRADGGSEAAVTETVFRMMRPDAGRATFDAVVTKGGNLILLALDTVADGIVEAAQQAQMEQVIAQGSGRFEFQAYVGSIRDEADVTVYQETLANAL